MNWQLLIPLLITTVVAVVGWLIAHALAAARDRANKRREMRVAVLIEAYRALIGIGIPKDILWRTPEEIASWSGVRTYVTTAALHEGRLLYEKQP